MKRLLFSIVILIVVMLAIGVTPIRAQDGDPVATIEPTPEPVVTVTAVATQAADPIGSTDPTQTTEPAVKVSWISWILLHVATVLSIVLAALTAVITVWSNALAQIKRQEERLAMIENLAKSAPPELINVVKLLITGIGKVGQLATETSELGQKLTDNKVDYSLNPLAPNS